MSDAKTSKSIMDELGGRTEAYSPQSGRKVGRFWVYTTSDLVALPAREYLLKGLLSPAEMSILVGAPKSGKTFLAMHLGYAIAQGRSVFGRRVHAAPVLYLAAEGEAGVAARIRALVIKYGDCDSFSMISQPADLLHCDADSGDLRDLIEAVKQSGARLVFLDTLSRLFSGGDENGPGDMGKFVANVTALRHATGAHIVIVHHGTQKSEGAKPRGHGSLIAAADVVIEVTKAANGGRTANVTAAKDDPDGAKMDFRLTVVVLGTDDDGDPITTCQVEESTALAEAAIPMKHRENKALQILRSLITEKGQPLPVGCPDGMLCITEALWRKECEAQHLSGAVKLDDRRRAFSRASEGLIQKAIVTTGEGFVWPSHPPALTPP